MAGRTVNDLRNVTADPQHVLQQNLAVFSVAVVEHPLDISIGDPLRHDPLASDCPVLLRSFDQLLSVHPTQCRSHQTPSSEMVRPGVAATRPPCGQSPVEFCQSPSLAAGFSRKREPSRI